MKKQISTSAAPAAIGPYSQGIVYNSLVFVSGQIPIDPTSGNLVDGPIEKQAHQVFRNVKAVLEAAGSGLDKTIKVTIFLRNLDDFAVVNQIYGQYFSGIYPARSTIGVTGLPRGAAIEVEAVAHL